MGQINCAALVLLACVLVVTPTLGAVSERVRMMVEL